jgi:hypothetical protein
VIALEHRQLAVQPVILLIGDRRLVEDVVLVVRALELLAQRRGAGGELAQLSDPPSPEWLNEGPPRCIR